MLTPRRIYGLTICVFACVLLNLPAAAQTPGRRVGAKSVERAQRRFALVIGNSSYKDAPLVNPVNDANDMAVTLAEFGFEVIKGLNVDQRQMKQLIRQFGQKMQKGGVGLFYFSGHGIQVNGINYLVPVGAVITKDTEVEYESIDAGFVLAQMEAASNQVNVIILDACRNNPFARSFRSGTRGLAAIDAPKGSIIAYATAPGSTASDGSGRNGLYTGALLTHMKVPGRSLEEVFSATRNEVMTRTTDTPVPWESTSLRGRFSFVESVPVPDTRITFSPEYEEWLVVRNSLKFADVQGFLQRFPDGEFATAARLRLEGLTRPEPFVPHNPEPLVPPKPAGTGSSSPGGTMPSLFKWSVVAEKRITIAANEAWTETAMQVKRGQEVWITANGQSNLGALGYSGPDGISTNDPKTPSANCQTGAIVARLGKDVICINAENHFTASADGWLALGLNESNFSDNSGGPVAKVVVRQKQ